MSIKTESDAIKALDTYRFENDMVGTITDLVGCCEPFTNDDIESLIELLCELSLQVNVIGGSISQLIVTLEPLTQIERTHDIDTIIEDWEGDCNEFYLNPLASDIGHIIGYDW